MKKLFYLLIFLLLDITVQAQCAMCKSTVSSNLESGGNTGRGINTGILYLLAIPYLLIGGLLIYIFRKQITARFKQLKTTYFQA